MKKVSAVVGAGGGVTRVQTPVQSRSSAPAHDQCEDPAVELQTAQCQHHQGGDRSERHRGNARISDTGPGQSKQRRSVVSDHLKQTNSDVVTRRGCTDSLIVYCGHRPGTSDIMSSSVVSPGNNRNSGLQRNYLRRSDSYRRAKNVMSPDIKQHRKSVEIVTNNSNNNSSALSADSKNQTLNFVNTAPLGSNSSNSVTIITTPVQTQNGQQSNNSSKSAEKPAAKNNFFKSLRSSFSFSSLRVKKGQARPSIKSLQISSPLEASRDDSHLYQVIKSVQICLFYLLFRQTFCLQVHTAPSHASCSAPPLF